MLATVTLFRDPPAPRRLRSGMWFQGMDFLGTHERLGSELTELRVLMQFTYRSITCANICCHHHLHAAFIC